MNQAKPLNTGTAFSVENEYSTGETVRFLLLAVLRATNSSWLFLGWFRALISELQGNAH